MLDSGRKRSYADSKVVTIIGPGTSITGEIHSKGTVRVEGAVSGRVQSDDTIVVQETGRVKAELVGAQIVISGRVEGNVIAQERLEVIAGGQIVGDITAPRVAIADGVLFEGKCVMRPPGESVQAKSAPADGQRENTPEAQSRL
jgi:cytoskeletal protein CcmA (bactofilin family)